jgi:hypothetical protein
MSETWPVPAADRRRLTQASSTKSRQLNPKVTPEFHARVSALVWNDGVIERAVAVLRRAVAYHCALLLLCYGCNAEHSSGSKVVRQLVSLAALMSMLCAIVLRVALHAIPTSTADRWRCASCGMSPIWDDELQVWNPYQH